VTTQLQLINIIIICELAVSSASEDDDGRERVRMKLMPDILLFRILLWRPRRSGLEFMSKMSNVWRHCVGKLSYQGRYAWQVQVMTGSCLPWPQLNMLATMLFLKSVATTFRFSPSWPSWTKCKKSSGPPNNHPKFRDDLCFVTLKLSNYYYYLLQLGCYPVTVVILHLYKTWNWLLPNLSREGYMRSM